MFLLFYVDRFSVVIESGRIMFFSFSYRFCFDFLCRAIWLLQQKIIYAFRFLLGEKRSWVGEYQNYDMWIRKWHQKWVSASWFMTFFVYLWKRWFTARTLTDKKQNLWRKQNDRSSSFLSCLEFSLSYQKRINQSRITSRYFDFMIMSWRKSRKLSGGGGGGGGGGERK